VDFISDSKHRTPLSPLAARSLPQFDKCLILVRPYVPLSTTRTGTTQTQKTLVTDNHKICRPTDLSSSKSSPQCISVYREKASVAGALANTSKTCRSLLDAMNSSRW